MQSLKQSKIVSVYTSNIQILFDSATKNGRVLCCYLGAHVIQTNTNRACVSAQTVNSCYLDTLIPSPYSWFYTQIIVFSVTGQCRRRHQHNQHIVLSKVSWRIHKNLTVPDI